jgi:hypothetical protein
MNLLEHSISGADKKPDLTTRSLSFGSAERHPETGEAVERSWKVTFSAEYGRPTPKDDDVFVALLKVTQLAGLMEGTAPPQKPQVHFSSYQLIRILGWPDNGASYQAIDGALNRIGGVWIVAKNYWYDNAEKEYVDRKFGIIDDVFLYERDKYDRALKRARTEGRERPLSWIRWSDVMADSFRAGYVRKLDIEVYRSLEHPIARKLYRYLGKQFWNRSKHRIDLQTLCHEKLGYQTSETRHARLREKLKPAVAELEAKGIYGLTHEFDSGYGRCEVVFVTNRRLEKKTAAPSCPLTDRLVSLGLDRSDAAVAVQRHSTTRITEDIEHLEFEAKAGRIKSSKPGLLAMMLKSDDPWGRPQGFVSSAQREVRSRELAARTAKEQEHKLRQAAAEEAKAEQQLAAFNVYMAGLSPASRASLEQRAMTLRNGFYGKRYREAVKEGQAARIAACLHDALFAAWQEEHPGAKRESTKNRGATVQKSIRF